MTKAELVKSIAEDTKLSQEKVRAVLNSLDENIIACIKNLDNYVFKWANIKGVRKPARVGFHPQTSEEVIWPSKIVGVCKFGAAIKKS